MPSASMFACRVLLIAPDSTRSVGMGHATSFHVQGTLKSFQADVADRNGVGTGVDASDSEFAQSVGDAGNVAGFKQNFCALQNAATGVNDTSLDGSLSALSKKRR